MRFDGISDLPRSAYFASDGREGTFLEALVRYGNRVQSEKANVQQSLFGGGNAEADMSKARTAAAQNRGPSSKC
ncbi:MAG: hypothetical protein ACLR8Y_18290 [Alistipes indistinctus]